MLQFRGRKESRYRFRFELQLTMADQRDKDGASLLGRLKGLGRQGSDTPEEGGANRRASKRVELPIPVQLKIGEGNFEERRLRNVNLVGLCIDAVGPAAEGEMAVIQFEGYPRVCEPFLLLGDVVRMTDEVPPAAVIEVNRKATGEEALAQYRKLVLHFIHHRGLLEDLWKGYFEARCPACGWLGKVGERSRTCAKCGGTVVPVAG
ncbi:MAG: PilZ domain-containing protein [Thermoanaerobaculia bacterium]